MTGYYCPYHGGGSVTYPAHYPSYLARERPQTHLEN